MKNIGQGSLFDEPCESTRWHRFHASPASGRGGCSLDIGPVRWRGEGGDQETKRELAYRVALCWNLGERHAVSVNLHTEFRRLRFVSLSLRQPFVGKGRMATANILMGVGVRIFLKFVAVVAALPSVLLMLMAPSEYARGDIGDAAAAVVVAILWSGFVYLIWWLVTRGIDKAQGAAHFAADQIERRTRTMEQRVDAETINHIAGAGKIADESKTAHNWTTRTDAFGRIVDPEEDES